MEIYSHRGEGFKFKENTLEAFKEAFKNKINVELDVRLTADKQVVVFHDENLVRLFGINKKIIELKYSELTNLNYKIPLLSEVLKLSKNYPITLAIQPKESSSELIDNLLTQLRTNGYLTNKFINSFFIFDVNLKKIKKIKKYNSNIKIGVSVGDSNLFPNKKYPTIFPHPLDISADLYDIIWLDEWVSGLLNKSVITHYLKLNKEIIIVSPELHQLTTPMHPNANNFQKVWKKLHLLDIDGICTDHPLLCRTEIHKRIPLN